MQIWTENFPKIGQPIAVCIGKFDGLHIGHRLILSTLADEARRHGAQSVAYSFQNNNGALLDTAEEKLEMLQALGMDHVVLAEMGREFMALSPEDFIARLAACGELKAVAVGGNFRFGSGASGDVMRLKRLGLRHGFDVHAIGQVEVAGLAVSSTLIRERVKAGDVESAALMLGREYRMSGIVIDGRRLGRTLGFPTANIAPQPGKALPAFGVYAAWAEVGGRTFAAMTDVGNKPTVQGREILFETHLLDFQEDIYGQRLTLRLVRRLRDEVKFDGVASLAVQLRQDMETVRGMLLK
jgi:riboflavin kinase / FMN adenylyltransferase